MSKVVNLGGFKDKQKTSLLEKKIFELEMQIDFAESVIDFVERNRNRHMSEQYAKEQLELSKKLIDECKRELTCVRSFECPM